MLDKVFVGQRVSNLDIGEIPAKITRVNLLVDSDHMYTAGNDTGRTIEKTCPWGTQAMCNSILARVSDVEYQPFSCESGLIDPAAETGDGITVGGVYSVLADSTIKFNGLYSAGIAAPAGNEVEEEYPYKSRARREQERQLAQTRSSITKTAEEIRLEVAGLSGQVSTISLKVDSITSTVKGLSGQVSTISQTVNDISLSVTGSLGGTASITLSSGGSKSGTIDLSGVRNAFKNDSTEINITAGKVTFSTGTFAVNGNVLKIDDYSVSTVSGEYKTSIANGRSSYFYIDGSTETLIGGIGTNYWSDSPSARGLTFSLDDDGSYMAWENYDHGNYIVKMLYTDARIYNSSGTSYVPDTMYFECAAWIRERLTFGAVSNEEAAIIEPLSNGIQITAYKGDARFTQIVFAADDVEKVAIEDDGVYFSTDLNMGGYEIYNTSDERLKNNIALSDLDALSLFRKINLYSFDWLESGKHEAIGFIAQQLEQDASRDFVKKDSQTGVFSVSQLKMLPYLVKAVKELDEKVNALVGETVLLLGETESSTERKTSPWTPSDYTIAEKTAYLEKVKAYRKPRKAEKPKPVIMPPH